MDSKNFSNTSLLYGSNADFIEDLYKSYLENKASVSQEWQQYFDNLGENPNLALKSLNGPTWHPRENKVFDVPRETFESVTTSKKVVKNLDDISIKAQMLVERYRCRGHFLAKIDPLGLEKLPSEHDLGLDLPSFELEQSDLSSKVELLNEFAGSKEYILEDLLVKIKEIYCNKIGYEISHIDNREQKAWLQQRIEIASLKDFSKEERLESLEILAEVEGFEQFLHSKFPGAKRFSIEGGDVTIVAVKQIIKTSISMGIKEAIFGMAHRGRLNMLVKVLGKPYKMVLAEFQGKYEQYEGQSAGDVKYHLGWSTDLEVEGNKFHMSLVPNPSHLEAVNAVVAGKVRAKQDQYNDQQRDKILGVLLHGDASFSGQGVVFESLMLSELKGYSNGGIIHIVINNQVGFTATPEKGRSTRYCTEVAKTIKAPIFHINGNDVDEVLKTAKIAAEFKQKFKKDVVMDIVCYRLYGHNEMDEPRFTQPDMYKEIAKQKTPGAIYAEKLMQDGVIDSSKFDEIKAHFRKKLDKGLEEAKSYIPGKADWLKANWASLDSYAAGKRIENDTGVDIKILTEIGNKLTTIPADFNLHKTIERGYAVRKEAVNLGKNIDWSNAEALAFGSLLIEGIKIRLTGQDSRRGTFSQRQSVLIDQQDSKEYTPLNNLKEGQALYEVEDSPLSEYAVLGFEYGYSIAGPNSLVVWEAQFGDFVNGAQIVIDQFIASAETKWLKLSGLVMLLPHAHEGQGSEHTSARLERFLQLCAEDNIQIVNLTTPANYFHVLRRQIYRNFRKPLIVMTPKSLLRHKLAISKLDDMGKGTKFEPVISDNYVNANKTGRLLICSGKIYYDLFEAREEAKKDDIAIIRLEEIYPFPSRKLEEEIKKYDNLKEIIWCQEEAANNGAWFFVKELIQQVISSAGYKDKIFVQYIGRVAAASPATGYDKIHEQQQKIIMDQAIK